MVSRENFGVVRTISGSSPIILAGANQTALTFDINGPINPGKAWLIESMGLFLLFDNCIGTVAGNLIQTFLSDAWWAFLVDNSAGALGDPIKYAPDSPPNQASRIIPVAAIGSSQSGNSYNPYSQMTDGAGVQGWAQFSWPAYPSTAPFLWPFNYKLRAIVSLGTAGGATPQFGAGSQIVLNGIVREIDLCNC